MEKSFFLCFLLVVFSTHLTSTAGLKILGISTMPSPSHHIWFTQLMKGLARNGHQVYALALEPTEFGDDEEMKNRTTSIVFEGMLEEHKKNGGFSPADWSGLNPMEVVWYFYEECHKFCEAQMATDGAKQALELVKGNKIDVIVHDLLGGQCFYAIWEVAQGNPAIVGFTPFGSPNWVTEVIGGNNWPAIKPFPYYFHSQPFTLWEKTVNFIYLETDDILRQYFYMPKQQEIAEKFIGKKMTRSLYEWQKRISIMLVNTYAALDPGVFLPPNAIEVGGLHVRDLKPLPKDIKEFLDGAEHGAVVISLGTNVRSSSLGSEKLNAIVAALGQLKQRVLWKFEDDHLPGRPENVMIKKWLPQSDVLAHPKVRVLWSHSGLLSTQEAVWRGIPIIGMPFFVDQPLNIDLLVKKGVALCLDFESLTMQTILHTLDKILTDRSFSQRMQQLSLEYRDRPMLPLDLAVWHVEYAARHPGGPLASPGRDLNRFQLNLFDVYALLGGAVLLVCCISWLVLRVFFSLFCSYRRERKVAQKWKRN